MQAAYAVDAPAGGGLEEIVVTAQKRSENLQSVPLSIQAMGTQKLEELHIANLDDYVQYLPGITTVKGLGQGGNGIGTTHVYMRGVVSGQDGNHSASQPSVGTYLDEQPVTTIDGTVDVHVYDIQRVEVLEGPQGTLYGASSEAGTIRIITNKPDPSKFSAAYNLGVNSISHGGQGTTAEGYVNIPLSPIAALRLVAWDVHDAGYISNVAGTETSAGIVNGNRSFPTWTGATGQTLSNATSVNKDYNTVSTWGGRAALKFDLGDNWTVTPTFMGQNMNANGFFGYDPAIGDLKLTHFGPESTKDNFTQTALTVQGKVNDFDIVYAGGFMKRTTLAIADYSDYSYFYDKYYGSGALWNGNNGKPVMPQEFVLTAGQFEKWSHEFRVNTPVNNPVRATFGAFVQRQLHNIWEQYTMPGLGGSVWGNNPQGFADALSVPGLSKNTIWLTDLQRVDRDSAIFGQATWDIDPSWALTAGVRFFKAKNGEQGFYGYSAAYQNLSGYHSGQNACGPNGSGGGQPNYAPFRGGPCTNLDALVSESGHTQKVTLSYKFDADKMVYATYSTGFRPGGINRVYDKDIHAIYPPYQPDYLNNYELGWKTQTSDHQFRWNGAVFLEKWNDFQFSFLGPNSVTVVQNAASAKIKGVETDFEWALAHGLTWSVNATYIDAKLTSDFCGTLQPGTTQLVTSCPTQSNSFADGTVTTGPLAVSGQSLPVVPKFKGNTVLRYSFGLPKDWIGNVQGAYVYQTSSQPLLRLVDQQHLGPLPAFGLFDLSGGVERNGLSVNVYLKNAFDERGQLTRFAQCTPTTCSQNYVIPTQPRTIGLSFGQKF